MSDKTCTHCAKDYPEDLFKTVIDEETAYCPECYAEYLEEVAIDYGLKNRTCGECGFIKHMKQPKFYTGFYCSYNHCNLMISKTRKACDKYEPKGDDTNDI